jgi:hypothetical protein
MAISRWVEVASSSAAARGAAMTSEVIAGVTDAA